MPSSPRRTCPAGRQSCRCGCNRCREFKPFEQPVIAHDKVRYVGEPMAVVLADSVAIGEDALEAIAVDDRAFAGGRGLAQRRKRDRPCCSKGTSTNRSLTFHAVRGDADAAFRERALHPPRDAAHRRAITASPWSRAASWPSGMRPKAGSRSPARPRCRSSTAASSPSRSGSRKTSIDMIENDVGGGFGARGEFYPEDFLIPFAARHLNRPVKWIEDRRENLMAMNHAREAEVDVEIACARDGTILGAARPRPYRHGRLYAHQRRGRRAQHRAVHGGAVSHSERQGRRVAVDDQQDAGRHLSRAWSLRDRFLP